MERVTQLVNQPHYHHSVRKIDGGIYNGNTTDRDTCIGQILNKTIVQSMIAQVSSEGLDGKKFDYTITRIDGKATILVKGDKNNGDYINLDDHVITLLTPEKGSPSSPSSITAMQKIYEKAQQISSMAEKLLSKIHSGSTPLTAVLNAPITLLSDASSTEWNTAVETTSDSDSSETDSCESDIPTRHMSTQKDQLKEQKALLATANSGLRSQHANLETLTREKEGLAAANADLVAEKAQLQAALQAASDKDKKLVAAQAEQIAQLSKTHLEEIAALKLSHQAEVENALAPEHTEGDLRIIEDLENQKRILEQQFRPMETAVYKAQAERKVALDRQKVAVAALTTAQNEVETLKAQLAVSNHDAQAAKEQLEQLEPLKDKLAAVLKRNKRLEGAAKNQKRQISDMTTTNNRLLEANQLLRAQNKQYIAANAKLTELEKEMQMLTIDNTLLLKINKKLNEQIKGKRIAL
ncbi:MAG: hypothetical protein SP4CHLAM5_12080 [Chlamydiia bacterium]|nr:hypothetical protein [Chlamydiia bacterium]MCH9619062.1 hypothetical protein [Chlamydiia bacterium]